MNSLIAFENNVKFSTLIDKSNNNKDMDFFLVTGPGKKIK
jgi:hypothetical protein